MMSGAGAPVSALYFEEAPMRKRNRRQNAVRLVAIILAGLMLLSVAGVLIDWLVYSV